MKRFLIPLLFFAVPLLVFGEPQDPPDIQGYEMPALDSQKPAPRAWFMGIVDMGILFLALSLATWFILKKRSRKGIFFLSLFSLGYFGFYREGCVCPIGSIQNVAQALFDPLFIAPLVVIFFFFLPLLYSALFGRSYCASVCPHGAIQDLVLTKPIELPDWLEHGLGILPYIYLGLGVLFAATGTAYIICDYDPFIAIFRLSGSPQMLGLGALFLIAGMFIGRPYCRFMCPYGVLLRMFSHVSRWQVTIYPDRCINCSLCDHSCPFGAIRKTTPEHDPTPPGEGKRRLATLIVLTPIILISMGYFASQLTIPFSKANEWVKLSYQVEKEELQLAQGKTLDEIDQTERSMIWRNEARITRDELMTKAASIQGKFYWGTWALGIWVGIVICAKLFSLSIFRKRDEYEAHRGSCYACGRCYDYCPGSNGVPIQFETGGHLRNDK